jgi:glutathione synthase/RimK-type ligase-like ATP-grasp enzyme
MVTAAADEMGVPYFLFNQRNSPQAVLACWWEQGQAGGELRLDQQHVYLHALRGVYLRLMDFQELPEFRQPDGDTAGRLAAQAHISGLHQALQDWLEVADLRVMNRSSAMGSNLSKPYQAQLIAQAGFSIPPTLVTNDPGQARQFIETHGRVVYKSISSVRSIVQELPASRSYAGYDSLEKIRSLPTQFQAFIPGHNFRIHVAGDQVFAAQMITEAIDYRYAGREGMDMEMEEVEVTEEIAERCMNLSHMLGLPLCGIDLKRTSDGEWFCFEVNPSPAFSYYQEHTGQKISHAIVAFLAQAV